MVDRYNITNEKDLCSDAEKVDKHHKEYQKKTITLKHGRVLATFPATVDEYWTDQVRKAQKLELENTWKSKEKLVPLTGPPEGF